MSCRRSPSRSGDLPARPSSAQTTPRERLPLITLALGFVTSYLLELFRNRWTTRNTQEIRTAERQQAEHVDRVAFERDGLRAMHAAIHILLDGVNTIAVVQVKTEPAGLDWRESGSGQEMHATTMHATVRRSHESALLLHPPVIEASERLTAAAYPMYWTREFGTDARHSSELHEAATIATRTVAAGLRELYGFTTTDG